MGYPDAAWEQAMTVQEVITARLAIACPITSQVKGYPFEVALPAGGKISGVVLADHVKNLDWQARRVVFEAKAPAPANCANWSPGSECSRRHVTARPSGLPHKSFSHSRQLAQHDSCFKAPRVVPRC